MNQGNQHTNQEISHTQVKPLRGGSPGTSPTSRGKFGFRKGVFLQRPNKVLKDPSKVLKAKSLQVPSIGAINAKPKPGAANTSQFNGIQVNLAHNPRKQAQVPKVTLEASLKT